MPGMKQIQEEVWAELKSRTTVTWLRIPHADLTWLNVASSWFHIPKISTEYEWLPQNTTKIKPLCTINFIFSSFYQLTCLLQTTYWLNFMVNKAHKGQQYDTVRIGIKARGNGCYMNVTGHVLLLSCISHITRTGRIHSITSSFDFDLHVSHGSYKTSQAKHK